MPATSSNTLHPGALRTGDAVALVSPAGPVDPGKIQAAVSVLEGWGLRPRVYPHALGSYSFYSGTDEERLADLNAALADPEIRAVICTRGGYGVQRIVQQVDMDAVRRDPNSYNDPATNSRIVLEDGLVGCVSCHATHDLSAVTAGNVRQDVCIECHRR